MRQVNKTEDKKPTRIGFRETVRALWMFLDEDKKVFGVGFLVVVAIYFYDIVPVYVVGKIIDFFTAHPPGASLAAFYGYTIFLGVSWAVVATLRLAIKNHLNKLAIRAGTRARVLSFEKLLQFSLAWHSKENSGNKIQRISSGGDAVRSLIRLAYNDGLRVVTRIGSVIFILAFLDLGLAAILFVYAFLLFYVQYAFTNKVRALSDEYNKSNEGAAGILNEGAGNMLAIKSLGAEHHARGRVAKSEAKALAFQLERADLNSKKWTWFQLLTGIFMGGYVLLLGRGFLNASISVGSIAVFFAYFQQLREACNDATDFNNTFVERSSDVGRLMELFKDAPKVRSGSIPFPASYEMVVKNASFTYQSGSRAMNKVNLTIRENEILGVAGHSGSGKSTLAKILLGLYELDKGSLMIGGVDYYQLSRDDVVENVSVVLQETELFNLSLRENVTLMRDVPAELLEESLAMSQLEELVERLPNGLDTLIGERGYMLSGGERQRLGIARAICKNPKIMILDEATASLDSKTEKKIVDALMGKYHGKKTFVLIAHRLSTLKNADRVVVFDKGSIVEEGKFSVLSKASNSLFAEMYKLQTEKHITKKAIVVEELPKVV